MIFFFKERSGATCSHISLLDCSIHVQLNTEHSHTTHTHKQPAAARVRLGAARLLPRGVRAVGSPVCPSAHPPRALWTCIMEVPTVRRDPSRGRSRTFTSERMGVGAFLKANWGARTDDVVICRFWQASRGAFYALLSSRDPCSSARSANNTTKRLDAASFDPESLVGRRVKLRAASAPAPSQHPTAADVAGRGGKGASNHYTARVTAYDRATCHHTVRVCFRKGGSDEWGVGCGRWELGA